MIHFKSLAKYYGITAYNTVKIPTYVEQATAEKYKVMTPDAQVQSITATQLDKHMFIKFLITEIQRLNADLALRPAVQA